MERIRILVPSEPIPAARPRFSGRHCYQPKRNREYRAVVQQAARLAMNGAEPLKGEVSATVKLYRRFKPTARNFGDCDNHVKAVLDALNGICYKDDAQVAHVTADKCLDKDEPRVTVDIALVGFENIHMPALSEGFTGGWCIPRPCPCEPAESSVTPELPAA